jgi:hypothetical protein
VIKTGIVVATTVSGLLVGSPIAWAACHKDDHHKSAHHNSCKDRCGDRDDHKGDHKSDRRNHDRPARHGNAGDCNTKTNNVNSGRSGGGLINISDVNVAVPVNLCNNDILSGVLGVLSGGLQNNDRH